MIRDLISRVLNKVAGEYVLGLTKENLKEFGLFSGEVKIQNVSLNPHVIDMLNLPINHQFSKIEKFELKAPISSLGSKPVELSLEGLYLVVTPKEKKEWTFQDYNSFRQKLSNIESFAAECIQKIVARQLEKNKSEEKDAGYIQKLTMKVVDNLQITIRNIHVRFEDTITKKYSWGFCLDKIEAFTLNKDGQKTFIDRTIQENKNEPTRKLLMISNAGVYWNAHEERFIADYPEHKRIKVLNGMIMKEGQDKTEEPVDFLLKISFQISLVMNNKGNFDVPEIKVNLHLDRIALHLQQRQLQQVIEQLEYIFQYANELAIRKKNNKNIEAQEIERLSNIFSTHFTKIMQQEKEKQSYQSLAEEERKEFEDAIIKLDIEILQERAKKVVIEIQKAVKRKELEKKQKEKKQGFMGYLFKAPKDLITEQEKAQIQDFIDENFSEEAIDSPQVIRPKDYVYLIMDYTLQGASIKLSNDVGAQVQCLQFKLNQIQGNIQLREENKEVKVCLKSMELQMIDEYANINSNKVFNILCPTILNSKNPLIEFSMVTKPLDQPHIDTIIDIKIRSLRFDHNPHLIQRLTQFLDVNVTDEELKQQAKDKFSDKIEENQISLQERMKNDTVLKLKVDMDSPIIVIPFKADGSLANEAWVLNLGNLQVDTVEDVLQPNLPFEIKALDMYNISLSKTQLTYYPSIEQYNKQISFNTTNQFNEQNNPKFYHTIEEFSINLGLTLVKSPAQGKINRPNFYIKGGVDQINLKLNPTIYQKLLKISECFEIPVDEFKLNRQQTIEQIEQKKNVLLSKSIKSGIIYKRGKTLKTWARYNGVLSGGYIYLFQNPWDLKPTEAIWVKNSIITQVDENFVGFKNAFSVKNKYTDVFFACDKENSSHQWIESFEKIKSVPPPKSKITDQDLEQFGSEQKTPEQCKKSEIDAQKQQNFEFIQTEGHFEIGNIKLSLYDNRKYAENPFLILQTKKLGVQFYERKQKRNVNLVLGGLFLTDYLYQYKDESLNDFITSKSSSDNNKDNDLINIGVIILDKEHPDYKNVDLDVHLKFNNLILNYKPDTLAKVLLFIEPDTAHDFFKSENDLSFTRGFSSLGSKQSNESKQIEDESENIVSLNLQDNQTVLLQAKVQMKEIKIVLINIKNKLPINDILIQNINLNFQQKSDEIFVSSSLGNIQLRDLTNFPNTIYLEEDWQKIKPQELLGKVNINSSQNLLEVEFRSFSEGSKKIQSDNIDMFVKLNFNSIHLNYMQSPVMRFIDYVLVQFLEAIDTPYLYIDETEIVERNRILFNKAIDKAKDPVQSLDKFGKKKIYSLLQNPLLLSLDVVILNPLITLKPNPTSKEYIQADLGTIKVTNCMEKNGNRLLDCKLKQEIKETYSSIYNVNISNMQMRIIKEKEVSKITKKFNFNISVNLGGLFNEYKYIYGSDIKLDSTIIVKNHISPIIFRISNFDYNLIMKCIFHNIAYDDGCDRFLIHDWERNQKAQVIIEKTIKKEEEQKQRRSIIQESYIDKDGIIVQVDLESLSVFTLDKDSKLPFARVTLGRMRVIQNIDENINQKAEDKSLSTFIYAQTLNASYFNNVEGEYIETNLLGDISIERRYNKEEIQNLDILVNDSIFLDQKQMAVVQPPQIIYEFVGYEDIYNAKNSKKFQIVFELQMKPNGDKDIDIFITDIKVQAQVRPLLAIVDFIDLDPSTDSPSPIFEVELTKEQIEENEKEAKQLELFNKQQKIGNQSKINIKVKNIVICTPCPDGQSVLAIRGVFDIKMTLLDAQIPKQLKQTSNQDNQKVIETSSLSADLKNLEIFICNVEELKTKDFKQVYKRNILLPLNLHFKKSEFLIPTPEDKNIFINKTNIEAQLEKTIFKITLQDLTLINQTAVIIDEDLKRISNKLKQKEKTLDKDIIEAVQQLQGDEVQIKQSIESERISEAEKIKKELEQRETMLVQLAQHETQINQLDIYVDSKGLQIIIINDMNNAYVPVLDFNLYEMNVKMKQNNIQMNFATIFELSAEYYNPRVGLWEPIIERVGFSIDFVQSEVSNIKQLLAIEMNPNYSTFNVTCSTQFVNVVSKITQTVKRDIIPAVRKTRESYIQNINFQFLEEQKDDSFDTDNLQHISPYAVRNETGYPIEVITDLTNIKFTQNNYTEQKIYKSYLNNFEEKNFEVDMIESKMANDKKETFVFKKNSEQVKVKVLIPGQQLQYIQQIDLDKIRNRLRHCKNEANKKLFDVITEVKLDTLTYKKVLNISSPYQFVNGCNKVVQLTMYDERKTVKQVFKIRRNQKFPIPIDLINGQFCINLDNDINYSQIYSFNRLCDSLLNKADEIKLGDIFLMLKVHKDLENDKRVMFSLEPPYKIKNCLPKPLIVQFINNNLLDSSVVKSKKLTESSKTIPIGKTYEFYNCSQRKESLVKFQIPGHFPGNEAKVTANEIDRIWIKDVNGNQSEISVHKKEQVIEGCKQLYVYSKGYLINESPYKLNVYTSVQKNKKECKLVGGQNQIYEEESLNTNFILFGNETGELLSISDNKYDKISKPASIGGVGSTQIDLCTLNEQSIPIYQTMGINVSIKSVDFDQKLFSKVITISPRFIIVNKTGFQIQVKQKGQDEKITTIPKDARIPLHWYDVTQSRFLNIRVSQESKDWNWSGNLNVLELGTVNFMIRNNENKSEVTFLRTDVRSDDSNIFIVIEKVPDNERPYLIRNLSSKFRILLSELNVVLQPQSEESFSPDPEQQYYFSWEHPFDKEKKLMTQIIPLDKSYQIFNFHFSPDQIYYQDKLQIIPQGQKDYKKNQFNSMYLKWSIEIDGFTRIINFEDSSFDEPVTHQEKAELRQKLEQELEKRHTFQNQVKQQQSLREMSLKKQDEQRSSQEKNIIQQQISIYIKELGISVIQNHRMNEKPKELIYVTIKGLEFIQVEKEESLTRQLRVKLLNIDQNNSYTLQNPVILTPNKYSQYSKDNSPHFFINIMAEQNLIAKNITLFNNLVLEIDPFTLRIEEQFINLIYNFISAIEETRQSSDSSNLDNLKDQIDESYDMSRNQNKSKRFKWQEQEIPPSSIPTFINQLILSNIEANLLVKGKVKTGDADLNIIKQVFSAVGVVLTDIEAPIKLNGIKLVNCFEAIPGIISKLTTHYKSQAITEVLKACGSLNIIGNPVGLFQNISTGVTDLITKPAEGFVKGPLEGGLGIMQGASSLIKNTMAGAFNSVNKITGSLSSGVSALCLDEEYLLEREKMRQKKPQGIVDGAFQGATSIFSGVTNGITGVFLNPLEGAKKGGALGLLKGIGRGFAGLIAKPVSGVLDAASSVAGGIKNQITFGDEKANEIRLRNPRVFYGREGFYKEFIGLDAGIKATMQTTSKGRYADADFLQAYLIQGDTENENNKIVLAISYEVIMLFDEAKKKKKWYFHTEDFYKIEAQQNGVQLTVFKQIQKLKANSVFILLKAKEQREYIFQQLNTLKFQLDEEKRIKQLDS